MTAELVVTGLGEDGDGIAHRDGRTLYVEGALPGERLLPADTADGDRLTIASLLDPAPDRVVPICALAGTCGGCTLQHRAQPANLAWKSGRVAQALRLAGYDAPPMRAPLATSLRSRRRAELGIARQPTGRVVIGLRRRATHDLVDMTECHVLDPVLFALLEPLRDTMRALRCLCRRGRLLINLLPTGADLLLDTDGDPDAADRASLATLAARHRVTRIAWRRSPEQTPETLVQLAPSCIAFAGRSVDVPPGAFLQAAPDTEAAITSAVLDALPARPARPRVVELYAGLGTLTLPLATRARVRAYEGDARAAAALARAAAGQPVDIHHRDLARDPVTAKEIGAADAVVLDPPYGGAGRQLPQIAASSVPLVILVSCNPAALKREAAALRQSGFDLAGAVAIDQFLFSPRIESVSVFTREKKIRAGRESI